MEYSFRNSASDELTVVTLGDYYCTLKKGQKEEIISYASILSVRIAKSSRVYKMYIQPDDHKPVIICSLSYDKNGAETDQSREYALLVRVLHHHLKEKSTAVFSSGGSSEKIWLMAGFSVVISFTVCAAADFFGFSLMNPYAECFILSVLGIGVVIGLNANNMPKTYEPAEIPLQFLP